jgi:pimeloyl-ACP methyl ester carboxylesterase
VSWSGPTLFLSGTLDGRTYPESAREIATRFPNGTHVVVENGGHNLFEASPLIKDMIVAYMKGRKPASHTLTLDPPKFAE